MNLRRIVILVLLCLVSNLSPLSAADSPPNIVFFLIDDFGWSDLGCYGAKFFQSPNIDRMAAEGMRFTDAYAACPVCSPTRAAVMTGRWPARLNLTDWLPGRNDMPSQRLNRPVIRQQLPLEEVTLAELLKQRGYTCASIGKWHLGGEGFEPTKQGFDLNVGGDSRGTPLSYFAPYGQKDRLMPSLADAPAGEYLTDRLTAEAEKFIEQNRERPFFLYLPHFTVHTPLKAKAELIAKYEQRNKNDGLRNNPIYAAMIESLDESVGRIVKKLDALKLSERTIVIFTSDNGGLATIEGPNTPATNNSPLREGKGWLYEGGIRVPLLVKWPGKVAAGSVCSEPVYSIDFLPTIREAVTNAIAPTATTNTIEPTVDGVSILSLLTQSGSPKRDALYWHYPHYSNQGGKPGGAIREGDWKLIEFYETGRRELFNVKTDQRESNNVSDKHPDRVAAMAAKLDAWRKSVDARMPTANPNFVANPPAADGSITLHARTAEVHGVMLRYEPLPHKNTLGFWVRQDDWASWEFTVKKPGKYAVEILQGCGKGSGGSSVDFSFGEQTLSMTVEETGGFQNFVTRTIGEITLTATGIQTLHVKPTKKPGVAVMDLRQVVLRPAR